MMVENLHIFAGLAWDPAIRGILVVGVGVVALFGSVYLILATNVGARLGMLLAFAGIFGWLSIGTLYWWISPPGIGPRGRGPAWDVVEVYVNDPNTGEPKTDVVSDLPSPDMLPTAQDILSANPDLAKQFTTEPLLSDIAAVSWKSVPQPDELGGWRIMGSSEAGEAQAAADTALKSGKVFTDATEYKKLNAFEIGGKEKRKYVENAQCKMCLGRVMWRLKKASQLKHPTHYAVVQVQKVLVQPTVAGQAPPRPVVDESQPVLSVVLVRDLGAVRTKAATWFVMSFSLFLLFAYLLHTRDKTVQKNLAAAKAAGA